MPPTAESIREANVRYHDLAAQHYDSKWGIGYDEVAQAQVTNKLRKALGPGALPDDGFDRGLEIGAGTGYFTLNLVRAGVLRSAVASDISPGMLEALSASASELGGAVETAACGGSALPFEEESCDLVFGHAVLHHLPDLAAAFREFRRVLRPGGVVAFCGEPSRHGDRLSSVPKRGALALAPVWRALIGAQSRNGNGHVHGEQEDQLEQVVDVHAFTPADLSTHANEAGFRDVHVGGEELAASLFGWAN